MRPSKSQNIIPVTAKNLAFVIVGYEGSAPFSAQDAAVFMRKAYEFHPEIVAELLRQLASAGCEPYTKAYKVTMSGIRELSKFDHQELQPNSATDNFFKIVDALKGSSSDDVKSAVVEILTENITAAEQTKSGQLYAAHYVKRLSTILENDPTAVMSTMQFRKDSSTPITNILQKILHHHPHGANVIGNILARITVDTAKAMNSPYSPRVQILGRILGYVENALTTEYENSDERIEKGSEIVKCMSDGLKAFRTKAQRDHSVAENSEMENVASTFRIKTQNIVNETYRQILDPLGCIVSGSFGEKEQKVYLDAFTTFETSMIRGREAALQKDYGAVRLACAKTKT